MGDCPALPAGQGPGEHKKFIGFDKDENGELIINEKEAAIVRRIFAEYLADKGCKAIAKGLAADGILTATSKRE